MSGQVRISYAQPIGVIGDYVACLKLELGEVYEVRGNAEGYDVIAAGRKTRRFVIEHLSDASDPTGWSFIASVTRQYDLAD
jgi:hypothetical protein